MHIIVSGRKVTFTFRHQPYPVRNVRITYDKLSFDLPDRTMVLTYNRDRTVTYSVLVGGQLRGAGPIRRM